MPESESAVLTGTSSITRPRLRDPRAMVLNGMARRIGIGRLAVTLPSGDRILASGTDAGPEGVVTLHRWRALYRLIVGGAIGFAESYVDGDWSSPDLAAFLELIARNADRLAPRVGGTLPARLFNRLMHRGRANSRRGSRRNIAAHYDLGNAFYALWLDPSMTYSSALFARDDVTLEEAQAEKNRRAIELLGLAGGERVLEIGCGWGGLAETLARRGCDVTAITLSREQLDHASNRLGRAGLAPRADIRFSDYRDVAGIYDRIVSIEMIEAVGEEHWPAFFGTLRDRLRDGGTAVLQAITIADERFAAYRRRADFIQRHIFPGGMLPSPSVMREQVARAGLVLASAETFGRSYARTLAEWQSRFQAAWPEIAALGFAPAFKRKWEYYLAYCEAGFRAAALDVGFYRITKPG